LFSEAIIMSESALIGIDLGKHSFHLHGQDASGHAVFRKKLSRAQMMQFFGNQPACTVAMEACAGAHFVACQLAAMGHTARRISPQFVRPFVKGNKDDFVDAEAICEAASRPSMCFVSPKTESQQILSVLHRLRESLVHDRTKTTNQMHGFLLEFGISLPKGVAIMKRLASALAEYELPVRLVVLLQRLHEHFIYLDEQIKTLDKELTSQLADDDLGSRLLSMPCVCPITASLLAVEMGDGKQYRCSRDFAVSVGLVQPLHIDPGKQCVSNQVHTSHVIGMAEIMDSLAADADLEEGAWKHRGPLFGFSDALPATWAGWPAQATRVGRKCLACGTGA
jgi:transposase